MQSPLHPPGQDLQLVDPVVDEYCPLGHDLHVTVPVVSEYVPVGHDKQLDDPFLSAYDPSEHDEQVLVPPSEYFPVEQIVHCPLEYPYPEGHPSHNPVVLMQFPEHVDDGHCEQLPAPSFANVPAEQSVHDDDFSGADVPALHFVHDVAPVPE